MKKKKKLTRATKVKQIRKQLDREWPDAVKKRDGYRCVLTGATENIHAHHWVVRRKGSNATRWLLDNGVTVCGAIHRQVHKMGPALEVVEAISDYMSQFVSDERKEEIMRLGHGTHKFYLEDYEKFLEDLRCAT